ncbi:MAG: helix-turn-helix domain-containing protein [Lentisphaeria bacterium]|nr:helix-turn-helix domain-containing protein [Lentisphaeria bacterium]
MSGEFFSAASVNIATGFPLKIVRDAQNPLVPMHSHEFTEIAFVACGCACHTHISRDGVIYQEGLVQGDLFSVLPGEYHAYEQCRSMVLYNIYFDAAILDDFISLHSLPNWKILLHERTDLEMKKLHLSGGQLSRAVECLDRAIREAHLRQDGFETVMIALFLEFLIPAIRSPRPESTLGVESFGILESISLMEDKPEKKFTLKQLASISHMSIPSYTKKFRTATGLSPMAYLQHIRLLKVCDMLTMTDAPVQNIAEECGFCSPNYMIKLFHREIGVTPEQFRKRQLSRK